MSARYGTLTLDVKPEQVQALDFRGRRSRSVVKLVGAAVFLVAAAACVATLAHTSLVKVASTENVKKEFKALDAMPVNCDKTNGDYLVELPRYDPEFSAASDFYNACYYSFRCCTTTGNSDGCYVSEDFGPNCRGCIKSNSPRFVQGSCVSWLEDDFSEEPRDADWGTDDLLNDNGVPQTAIPKYDLAFSRLMGAATESHPIDTRSCWQPRGSGDKDVVEFSDKCFEVLSWCNELCPRDSIETNDHVMCKHCFLVGFQDKYFNKEKFDAKITNGRDELVAA